MQTRKNILLVRYIFFLGISATLLHSCANRGMGPQGGPKDEDPPKVLKEIPENGTLNYHDKRIEVQFDEYIQLDKVSENVLISPPQQRPPEVKAYGKKLYVNFLEDLKDSTTYTIDFGSAICDYNEKNPLSDYSFSFSTGDVIDSLQLSGILLNAEDLNPISGIVIGIHSDLSDTALATTPFMRITKTDAEGEFTVRNIHPGTYRLYALQDVNKDYIYQPGEGLAVCDSLLTPSCSREVILDTLWKDSVTIDTVMTVERTVHALDDVLLLFFRENKERRYFQRAIREQQHYFTLFFAASQDSLPRLKPLGDNDWFSSSFLRINPGRDTIAVWLTDSMAIASDTLLFEMTYYKSDSLYELQPQTDTVRAVYRAPRLSAQAKARMEKNRQEVHLEVSSNASSTFEIYAPLRLTFSAPVSRIELDSIRFLQLKENDSLPIPFVLQQADSSRMLYEIHHEWEPDARYELRLDSAAFIDLYGHTTLSRSFPFHTRTLDEYSTLIVKVEPYNPAAIVQILDERDQVLRSLPAKPEGARFEYLRPQSYYMRLYLDLDGDSCWTTGDWQLQRQPEPVYYYPSKLTLRANWDFEETFNYLALPLPEQKPDAILKVLDSTLKK